MSGGERRRVALARLLVAEPNLAILDEPTNHLDPETIEWLEEYRRCMRGAVLLVTHDRYVLDSWRRASSSSTRESSASLRQLRRLPRAEGPLARARGARRAEPSESPASGEGVAHARRARADDEAEGEDPEGRGGVACRRPRDAGRARLEATATRTGKTILELRERRASTSADARSSTVSRSTSVQGDRIGVIGANGAGKTSLLKIVTR